MSMRILGSGIPGILTLCEKLQTQLLLRLTGPDVCDSDFSEAPLNCVWTGTPCGPVASMVT
jgi:hypothetical protein